MQIKKLTRYALGTGDLRACGTLDMDCFSPSVDGICPNGGDSACVGIDGDCSNPDQGCFLAADYCSPSGDYVSCNLLKTDYNFAC